MGLLAIILMLRLHNMQVYFDHKLGWEEHHDIQLFNMYAKVGLNEEHEALEQGWLMDDNKTWYQSRNTRINLENFTPKDTIKLKVTTTYNHGIISRIYSNYIKSKGFKDLYNPVITILDRDKFIVYTDEHNVAVAFSKVRRYRNNSLESRQFCWDYADPRLRLGILSVHEEIKLAIKGGAKYYYLGPSYEESCIYKANFDGFEWWTGSEWSQDKKLFKKLLRRDSKIKTLQELKDIMTYEA